MRSRDLPGVVAAGLLGVVAFLLFVGWTVLIPTNIAWLATGDRSMHQLGWMFFRYSPWGLPPGISPNLGIELSNSIGLVDGLPLFALPFKLIQAWLPEPFQYWGYWLLLSFALQSIFAYLIARDLGAARILALVAAGFVLITPAFLFRVPMHLALSGHWVILCALWLYVRSAPPPPWSWPLLLALTASIHAYLLAMVLALWVADLVRRWPMRQTRGRPMLSEISLGIAAMLVVLWGAGFLMTGDLHSGGYGAYKLNTLALFIPYRWSEWFPQIPHTKSDYEGLSFLGIGVMALLLTGLLSGGLARIGHLFSRRWLPLAIVLLALVAFGLSNQIAFADMEIARLPFARWMVILAGVFRSTGRFVWPLLYLLTILAVVMMGWRLRGGLAAILAVAALGVQIYDSRSELQAFHQSLPAPAPNWTTPLVSPFWERAAESGYNRVRAIPVQTGYAADWRAMPYYAVTHGMDVDIVNLGRLDRHAREALDAEAEQALASGDLEPRTLYELDAPSASRIAAHLAPDDLLATIDDRIIFARHGAHLVAGLGIEAQPPAGG